MGDLGVKPWRLKTAHGLGGVRRAEQEQHPIGHVGPVPVRLEQLRIDRFNLWGGPKCGDVRVDEIGALADAVWRLEHEVETIETAEVFEEGAKALHGRRA